MTASAAQPPKILCSFHYFRKDDLSEFQTLSAGRAMIMGDSGAFSALSVGAPISYQQYTDWVRRWRSVLFSYPALDVIGNPEATWTGYRRMRRDGLAPLPVYHYGSPMSWLRRYLDAGEKYIALGGLVGKSGPDVKRWLVACFQAAQPYGAVYHGFGRTRMDDLRDFPWYSVDSSSFAAPARYGRVHLFDGHRFITLARNEPRKLYAHGALLRQHGVSPDQMDNRNTRVTELSYRVGTVAWRRCEEWLRQRHGPVPGQRPGDPPGPHLFLADAAFANVRAVVTTAASTHPGPYFTRSAL
jgi:hypothetical protein